jgi:hypothetical protein
MMPLQSEKAVPVAPLRAVLKLLFLERAAGLARICFDALSGEHKRFRL